MLGLPHSIVGLASLLSIRRGHGCQRRGTGISCKTTYPLSRVGDDFAGGSKFGRCSADCQQQVRKEAFDDTLEIIAEMHGADRLHPGAVHELQVRILERSLQC